MSTGVNCLISKQSENCSVNNFTEYRPDCSKLKTEQYCNDSQGCYHDGSQCKRIDPAYCEIAQNISACRKDANDYCYFTEGKCKACNTQTLNNSEADSYNLISMDGRHCFPKEHTCKPYYQDGNHAACRKYCEYLYGHDDENGKCIKFENSASSMVHAHVINVADCTKYIQNPGNSSITSTYSRYLNNNINKSYICVPDGASTSKINKVTIYARSLRLISLSNVNEANGQLAPNCSSNFKKVTYEPVDRNNGESGPLLTADGLDHRNNAKMISNVCTCPPGYKLTVGNENTADKCDPCPAGQTSIDYDSTECISTADMPTDDKGNILTQNCEIWQKLVEVGTTSPKYYVCQNCPPGQYGDGTECKLAPKSWYVKVPSKTQQVSRTGEQVGLLRCPNGTTASEGAYDEFMCQNINETGKVVLQDGSISDKCPDGFFTTEGSVMCQKCPGGQYRKDGSCIDCEAGTYRGAMDDDKNCTQCPQDTWSTPGSDSAAACVKCQQNKFLLGDCTCGDQCGKGTYGTPICKQCEDGKVSNGTDACQFCNSSEPVAQTDRATCKNGCPKGEGKETVQGTTRAQPVYQCKKCSAGRYSDGSTGCQLCAKGQITNSDQSSCNQCPYGHAAGEGSSQCDPCTGKFASSDSSTCVSQCESGYGPKLKNGTYLDQTTRATGPAICFQCPKTTHYSSQSTGFFCMPCQPNSQSKDGMSCECLSGYTLNDKGECISKTSSNAQKSSTPVGGIIAGVVVVLLIIAIVLGVVFGLKARRAKHNSVNIRRNVYDDQPRSNRRAKIISDDPNEGTRHSQLLI